jgi:hypothetical protein
MHVMAAAFFQAPELVLAPAEARALSDATAAVAAHYDAMIDPRTAAWLNLAMVAGGIYGTRAMAIWGRKKQEEPKRGPAPVAEFPQPKRQAANGAPAPAAGRPPNPSDIFGLGDYSFASGVQDGE